MDIDGNYFHTCTVYLVQYLKCAGPGSGDSWKYVYNAETYTVLILDNVLPYWSQGRPLAVVGGSDGTALVSFEFTYWKTTQRVVTRVWSLTLRQVAVAGPINTNNLLKQKLTTAVSSPQQKTFSVTCFVFFLRCCLGVTMSYHKKNMTKRTVWKNDHHWVKTFGGGFMDQTPVFVICVTNYLISEQHAIRAISHPEFFSLVNKSWGNSHTHTHKSNGHFTYYSLHYLADLWFNKNKHEVAPNKLY